jgi:acetyltransferase-like isoleucine patch superfamily enzyme
MIHTQMQGRRSRKTISWLRQRVPFTALGPLVPPGLDVGRHTYGPVDYYQTFPMYTEGARTLVGAFCSISPECRILGGGEHAIDRASTFPLNARLFDPAGRTGLDSTPTGPTVIGNDVYVGVGAIVLSGVTIGDGAVVGAGAVVTKPVPPYAIVAGNPARIIRYRFEPEARVRLLALAWWNWDDDQIQAALPLFMGDIEVFLDEMERAHRQRG